MHPNYSTLVQDHLKQRLHSQGIQLSHMQWPLVEVAQQWGACHDHRGSSLLDIRPVHTGTQQSGKSQFLDLISCEHELLVRSFVQHLSTFTRGVSESGRRCQQRSVLAVLCKALFGQAWYKKTNLWNFDLEDDVDGVAKRQIGAHTVRSLRSLAIARSHRIGCMVSMQAYASRMEL